MYEAIEGSSRIETRNGEAAVYSRPPVYMRVDWQTERESIMLSILGAVGPPRRGVGHRVLFEPRQRGLPYRAGINSVARLTLETARPPPGVRPTFCRSAALAMNRRLHWPNYFVTNEEPTQSERHDLCANCTGRTNNCEAD